MLLRLRATWNGCAFALTLALGGCSSALSTLPSEAPSDPPESPPSAADSAGPAGFFACDDLRDCKAKCDRGVWDGCVGAYARSDRSTPEAEAAAKVYLDKGCALGGDLACTMLEPDEPPVQKAGRRPIAELGNHRD